ncbi:hypothetical protein Tco_1036607, partial [Tanacetum coccineum]
KDMAIRPGDPVDQPDKFGGSNSKQLGGYGLWPSSWLGFVGQKAVARRLWGQAERLVDLVRAK